MGLYQEDLHYGALLPWCFNKDAFNFSFVQSENWSNMYDHAWGWYGRISVLRSLESAKYSSKTIFTIAISDSKSYLWLFEKLFCTRKENSQIILFSHQNN